MFNINNMLEILSSHSSMAIPISLLIGIGISLAGETIEAYITFTVYRLGFKKNIEKFTGKHTLLSHIVNSEGKRQVY